MNYLKKIVKPLLVGFLTMLISLFLFTTLEYIGWISNNTFKVMTTLISILGFLVSGIIFGKRSSKKGWLEGLKLSLIEIFLLIILNLGLNTTDTKNIILYSFILLATTIGSIIGVNKNNLAN